MVKWRYWNLNDLTRSFNLLAAHWCSNWDRLGLEPGGGAHAALPSPTFGITVHKRPLIIICPQSFFIPSQYPIVWRTLVSLAPSTFSTYRETQRLNIYSENCFALIIQSQFYLKSNTFFQNILSSTLDADWHLILLQMGTTNFYKGTLIQ